MQGEIAGAAAALWRKHGGSDGAVTAEPFAVGGNNRVFRLLPADGSAPVVVKSYFRGGPRDRLASEWAFLSYTASLGLRSAPRPIACDADAGFALYEWIDGRKLTSEEVGVREVATAAAFVRNLNADPQAARAARLPAASAGGFSIAEHFATTESRMARFAGFTPQGAVERHAAALIKAMDSYWAATKRALAARARDEGFSIDAPVAEHERLVSPSDFGFHNALLATDGRIVFLDFEYAGWDDVAKIVCDFFCQPAVPVDRALFDSFAAALLADQPDAARTRARVDLLQPVFALQWCCIMLNAFLPDVAKRGQFANPSDQEERKAAQLNKAATAFRHLKEA